MKKHILLVDDDKDELFIFEALSRTDIPHKCTWAKNGQHALSQLEYLVPDLYFLTSTFLA